MTDTTILCQDPRRRQAVYSDARRYGLDYVETGDGQERRVLSVVLLGKAPAEWRKLGSDELRRYFRIDGGRRIRGLQIRSANLNTTDDEEQDDWVEIALDKAGDFSNYTLSVHGLDDHGLPTGAPYPGFAPRYAGVEFSFLADCPSDLDCRNTPACTLEPAPPADINYLAKDYASFRQMLFDRLALLMPDWNEQHVPDLGVTLVELLAYSGDQLSYYQDAVATEAYLNTARRRVSVRRHARLVDYRLHEGCNARAWVCLWTSQDWTLNAQDVYCITTPDGAPAPGSLLEHDALPPVLPRPYLVFEPLLENPAAPIPLWQAHNEIAIYTWGDQECCLPKGATAATLVAGVAVPPADAEPKAGQIAAADTAATAVTLHLQAGDVLIFEEIKSPTTGLAADADPSHRHAVRLTRVDYGVDPLYGQPVAEVAWGREDALPFALCLSALDKDCRLQTQVSVARGNVILLDHGESFAEALPTPVPADPAAKPDCHDPCGCGCGGEVGQSIERPYRPALPGSDITVSQALPLLHKVEPAACGSPCPAVESWAPAAVLLQQDPRQALPQTTLYSYPCLADGTPVFGPAELKDPGALAEELRANSSSRAQFLRQRLAPATLQLLDNSKADTEALLHALRTDLSQLSQAWRARPDLLASGPDDCHFVLELEEDRSTTARFGDGELGRRPEGGTQFWSHYRSGNGPAGNVGAEAISHLVFRNNRPSGINIIARNPLPAVGGSLPESLAEARLFAPQAFRKNLRRAVTPDDYAAIVLRDFPQQVQRAAAVLRWNGSHCLVMLAVDPWGSEQAEPALLCAIQRHLEAYRRIGHDLEVHGAVYVPLWVKLIVCVKPEYLRGHVKAGLLQVLGNGTLADGRRGFFHPDQLSFGEGVYLSRLIAAAQAVDGVECVRVDALERLYQGPDGELDSGLLALGPLEIAQLDNDPNYPEHGVLELDLRGGR